MSTWLLLLQASWVAGFLALGCKTWLLQLEMSDHLAPGVRDWRLFWFRGIPATEQLTEAGRMIKQRYYRLLGVFIAYFVGGGLLLQHLSKVFAK
jgi:hypothetical protein